MGEHNRNKSKKLTRNSNRKVRRGTRFSKKAMNRRIFFMMGFLVILFFIIIGRLFTVQVIKADEYSRKALTRMTKTERIKGERGLIFDRNGQKLVSNVSRSDVSFDMDAINSAKDAPGLKREILEVLPGILQISRDDIEERFSQKGVVRVVQNIDHTKAQEVNRAGLHGVVVEDHEGRYYPNGRLASHVLGFTNSSNSGVYGLEAYYNGVLSGRAGKSVFLIDSSNHKLPGSEEDFKAPQEGYHLNLTLSENIQKKVEQILTETKELHNAKRISAIVQDTKTGEIIAMSTKDDFDPNRPRNPQTKKQIEVWDKLTADEKEKIWYDNWRNFATSDMYEPGSTFKTITAAAALEENETRENKHYYCTGYIRDLPGITITCTSIPDGHGDITMAQGFYTSCNTTFVNIGRELGKENLYKYIRGFGFGEPTGIDLPAEVNGIVPKSPDKISDVNLATMSYGHGIAVTPIQMINAISAVANGGYLMEPYIVKEIRDQSGEIIKSREPVVKRQVISSKTSSEMLKLLEGVTLEGTGSSAQIKGYRVGGKTGTADKVSEAGGYEKGKYISSFVGVAPINDPQVTVLVIVEEPEGDYYGGTVAAPATGKILEAALEELNISKDDSQLSESENVVLVPDVTHMLLEDAGKILTSKGLKFNTPSTELGDLSVVVDQSPSPGLEVKEGTIIDLTLDANDKKKKRMPILTGKTRQEVEKLLKELNVSYTIEGEGEVVEQSPKFGEIIDDKTSIQIRLAPSVDKRDDVNTSNNTKSKTKESNKNAMDE